LAPPKENLFRSTAIPLIPRGTGLKLNPMKKISTLASADKYHFYHFQHVKANDYLNIESAKYPSSTKYEIDANIKKIYEKKPIYTMRKKYPR
jgi:hypothetical protein